MPLVVLLIAPLGAIALVLLAARVSRRAASWAAASGPASALVALALTRGRVRDGEVLRVDAPWVAALDLELAFRLDALAWLFALLITGVGLLVVLYAHYYLPRHDPLGRFHALILAFMTAMLGVVTSGNLLLLVVCWELTSVTSFLLVGYRARDAAYGGPARAGARTALVVTGSGGLALLAGVLLLGRIAGTFDLDAVLAAGAAIRAAPLYPVALTLVLLGAFTKSAQWPFHYWLPRAMAAPTPASAYLHSATMVKAGVFLLARLHPVLAGTETWMLVVGSAGTITLVVSATIALWQHDLKGLLAWSTISHLGLITMLLGFGSASALAAAIFHIVNHATFKASLFMAAGIVEHETGTRDMRVLNGLARPMPRTAALAIVAAGAMAGVPLLNGFLSKEMFFAEALAASGGGVVRWVEAGAALLYGALGVGYSARFVMEVFFNADGTPLPRVPHEPPRFMRLPVELLVLLCIVVGVAPAATIGPALQAATRDALQRDAPPISLALWHGLNLPLLMTVLALAGGVALYRRRERLYAWHERRPVRVTAARVHDRLERAMAIAASHITQATENGSAQRSVALLLAAAGVVALGTLARAPAPLIAATGGPADAASVAGWALVLVAGIATVRWHRDRLAAVVAISAVGLFVALAFVRLGAPDLALTQLLVEVVTILLLLLALHHLPPAPAEAPRPRTGAAPRVIAMVIASAVGIGAGAATWSVLARAPYGGGATSEVAAYYLARSKPAGGGTNAVNVTLVDFRGLDTLGEIAVLACAALGAASLLVGMRPVTERARAPQDPDVHPPVLAMLARPFLPLALVLAAFLFLRGHDLPGGGFAAGLLVAVAIASQYLTSGIAWTIARRRLDAPRWVARGVLLAMATGVAALVVGRPFLTSWYGYVTLPLLGRIGFGSALVFDLGVAMAVLGAVLLVLERLGMPGAADVARQHDPQRVSGAGTQATLPMPPGVEDAA
ncbi:MAG: monovalent cation/H+ antiporter subunit A [Gemmatimonadaceae bacterium]|nr:monovalent cation/H+ antiporter subunit A [Gemmatimonadaceae bacterium]